MKHTSTARGRARRAPGSGSRSQAAVASLCREAEHMRRLLAPPQGRHQASSAQHSSGTVDATCSLMDRHGECKGCNRSRRRRREGSEDRSVLTGGGNISRSRQQRRSRRGATLVTAASTAFVSTGVDAPRRWAIGGRPLSGGCGGGGGAGGAIRRGEGAAQSDTWGQCVSGRASFQGDLRGGGGGGGSSGGLCRSPSRVLRMISAAGSQRAGSGGGGGMGGGAGHGSFSGDQMANAGGGAMVARGESGVGVDGTGRGSGGVGRERSVAVGQDAVSWTPKTEGQGSWDRLKAVAGLWRVDLKRGVYTADVKVKQPLGLDLGECQGGVCVSKVRPGCSAELQGVRPGDRVVATSATLGDGLWEKNTVDGILSAVGTRLVFSETVTLRVERPLEPQQLAAARFQKSVTQTFEVTLRRPPGLILEQIWDPSGNGEAEGVVVAGIVPGSPADLSGAVQQGDLVVAVGSSLGNIMWPYRPSPAEAATAAAAAAAENAGFLVAGGSSARADRGGGGAAKASADGGQQEEARTIVLERCGALVRSYGLRRQAIAVDNLLEGMEKAGVQINARFLNSALISYLLCKEPEKAVETFHAVTGIVWPDLPPWPSLNDSTTSFSSSSNSSKPKGSNSKRVAKRNAKVSTKGNNVVSPGVTTAASGVELPEEFRLLKEGPSAEDKAAMEASSWEGTGGQRFLQMRPVGAEAMAAAAAEAAGLVEAGGGGGGAHGRRRRLDDACRVVLGMVDWGLKPDVAVFNSFAAAAVWNGRIDLALEVVLGGVMTTWGVTPNQLSYNTIMDAYARAGNVNNVVKIYNFMQAEGVPPDVITTTILVKAQVGSGNVNAAMATLIEMLKASNLRDKLDAFPFNTIIQGLMRTLQWEKALDLFRSMRYHNVKPDLITFNSLLSGLTKARQPAMAVELFKEMMDMGIAPDVYTYSSLASAYAKLGEVAAAVKACIKGGQPGTALEVFEQLTSKGGVRPDEVISTLVVQAYAMKGDFDQAFQAITAMGKRGEDDKIPFNHLVRECVLAGEWGRASESVKRMLHQGKGGKGIRFDHNTFNAVSEVPRGYDGTEEASWPRLTFLMQTKDMVVARGWTYSSTLYLAILYECIAREDYAMANMIVEQLQQPPPVGSGVVMEDRGRGSNFAVGVKREGGRGVRAAELGVTMGCGLALTFGRRDGGTVASS
eukprot:jgi/Undpi1/6581/HiC_scaffold_20.g09060.m1